MSLPWFFDRLAWWYQWSTGILRHSGLLHIETSLSTAWFKPWQVQFLQPHFVISKFGFYSSISASESSVSNAPGIFLFPVGFLSLTAEDHLICRMSRIFPSGVVGGIFKPGYPKRQHSLTFLTVIFLSIVIPSFVASRSRRVVTTRTSERFILDRFKNDASDASKNFIGGIFCSGIWPRFEESSGNNGVSDSHVHWEVDKDAVFHLRPNTSFLI